MPEYRIVNTRQRIILDELRNPAEGVRVTFLWGDGQTGYVDVPLAQFTPQRVQADVEALIERLSAVAGLGARGR